VVSPGRDLASGLRVVADGLVFGEGPRWHDGRLWFSDMHAGTVCVLRDGTEEPSGTRPDSSSGRAGGTSEVEAVCEVPGKPSGLGWLPDGRLLVVSMTDRRVLRREADGSLVTHADLSGLVGFDCNDMVVDQRGNAYVGHFGFSFHDGSPPAPADVVLVRPDGSAEVAATDLQFPNGSVVTPDGRTLIVAESLAGRLTAFTVGGDGSLTDRRVWADLRGGSPDGICLDADGAVWYADPQSARCVRVAEGGEVQASVDTGQACFACMLGGPDRRTLFLVVATFESLEQVARDRSGKILAVDVDVAGAGWP
jgi:sugar lactone lactonase YvrE